MDPKIKNYLGLALVFALILSAFSFAGWVTSYSKSIDPSSIRSFSVHGEGEAVAIPDIAQFYFGLTTPGGADIAKAQSENTEKVNDMIEFLKSEGVAKKDIKTQSYNVYPRYKYYPCREDIGIYPPGPCQTPSIEGYDINQQLSVKVRDFDKGGDLLAGVVERGANNVSGINFTIDDPANVQDEARTKAIEKAKEKAKSIAKAGGFRLGKLLSIQESGTPYYPVAKFDSAMAEGGYGGGGPSPQIEPGSQDITVNVTLIYEIK
ncbi:MAG: hypothetical protein COV29_03685 [Candidatus Yanofskybacteria bacterium CG10_big_fil_rev_8_21_14_0_10_36_16]|uniref:SIMPL domain-containing protein n=1 Tax=Candidatus Yanofskybacteria bacterium CG10_big_fil_rev_8_21_14_0_10_36_16 TaxID=1975096 RepID=A0A2J0Q6J7_9BACT|nr:MAG: hypothetical protein COV29_03685 [Candidatus Yanofskybacteria bacterium CG10_big_fil_rev_8_21_14_0_10_36_16]